MITASASRQAGGRYPRTLVAIVRPVIRHRRGGNSERDGYAGHHQCADQPSRIPPNPAHALTRIRRCASEDPEATVKAPSLVERNPQPEVVHIVLEPGYQRRASIVPPSWKRVVANPTPPFTKKPDFGCG